MSTGKKNDGKLLEQLIAKICEGIKDAKVSKDVQLKGSSGTLRQIDVLIEGKIGPIPVRIDVECRDYKTPIDISKVDALRGKLDDTGIDLGVIVASKGFTKGAKKRAEKSKIQLIEPVSPELPNVKKFFIPIRAVIPSLKTYQAEFHRNVPGPFSVPHFSRIRIEIDGKKLNIKQLLYQLWNDKKFPQVAGNHKIQFGAAALYDIEDQSYKHYCEVDYDVEVEEEYYLGVLPAVGLKNISSDKPANLWNIDIHIDKIENEWQKFDSYEELKKASDEIEDQIDDVSDLEMRPQIGFDVEAAEFP